MRKKVGMTEKAIKSKISAVIKKLLKTIKDPELAGLFQRDAIVSGGCIASMLLGEEVNDYDIYFNNLDTAEKVAKYYIARDMKDGAVTVLRTVIVNIKGVEEARVLCKTSAGIARATHKDPFTVRCVTSNAVTLSDDVQLIIRFAGPPEEIHKNFDFIHCTNYYLVGSNELVLNIPAMQSLMSKRLYYHGSLYPVATLMRMRKFLDRGWTISAGQIAKVSIQLMGVPPTRALLVEQLIGVDLLYLGDVLNELQNGEGDIDRTYISSLLDEAFG